MIAQNSEVYNPPTEFFFHNLYVYNDVGGLHTSLFCAIIPTLFLTFCRSGVPTSCYIFKCFLLLVYVIFLQQRMQFAITEQKSVSSQVVGAFALVYGQC